MNMDMMNRKGKHALHAVIVPFRAQGRVNALVNLAQLLAIRARFVTFVHTESIDKRRVKLQRKLNLMFPNTISSWSSNSRWLTNFSSSQGIKNFYKCIMDSKSHLSFYLI
jgi:hypothetical protein